MTADMQVTDYTHTTQRQELYLPMFSNIRSKAVNLTVSSCMPLQRLA